MDDINKMVISLSNYKTFFSIATRSLSQVKILTHERDLRAKKSGKTGNDVDFICEKNAEIQRSAMVTVVFSVATIESYINEYGIKNFSSSYFDNYLDKLDIKSKWVIYPKLVTGKQIDAGSQTFESLGKLISLRNRLVHDRTRKKRICDLDGSDWVTELEAEEAVNTVRKLVKELAKLDTNIEIDWLNEAESDCFA
jgi:hypothetical protein